MSGVAKAKISYAFKNNVVIDANAKKKSEDRPCTKMLVISKIGGLF